VRIESTAWNRIRYDFYSPFYDWLIGSLPLSRRGRRRGIELIDPQPGERLLIVAGGTGLDLPHIPPGVDIVLTDISPGMLARARRRAARLGLPVDLRVMDAASLDFRDESFDCVLLHLALAVVPRPLECAREVGRVLRQGGRVSIFDKFLPEGRFPSVARRALNNIARVIATDINRELRPLLAGSGLRLTSMEEVGFGGNFVVARAVKDEAADRSDPG
jgi:phosphatidylethanolamine/phosphatidyl-N-methylethanolamine N-methyltransferase